MAGIADREADRNAGSDLKDNASLVELASSLLQRTGQQLSAAPDAIRLLLESGAWRHFQTRLGADVRYDRFEEFVVTPPLRGLGVTVDLVRRVVGANTVTLDLLDQTLQRPAGNPNMSTLSPILDNVQDKELAPTGNTKARALRRLRADAPELHERVLAGELTPHAAMIEAGFRPRTITIPIDPNTAADRIRRNFTPDQLAELIARLTAGDTLTS